MTTTNPTTIDATTKALRKAVNHDDRATRYDMKGVERANSNAVAVLADAVEEAGNGDLAAILRKVAEFLPVWAEHRNRFYCYSQSNTAATWATDRNKFIALDYGDTDTTSASGCFLVEKATGYVWTIKGYGKKKHICATDLAELTRQYQENIDQYDRRKKAGEQI
jgi:hypothetical protein